MNVRYFIDHIAKQIAALHAAIDALEDRGDHIAPVVTVRAGQATQVSKQPCRLLSVGPARLILIDETDKFIAGDALGVGGPVAPAVRRIDGRAEPLPSKLRLLLALQLKVVEKLQEHDPGEEWQAIKIAIQAFVLSH